MITKQSVVDAFVPVSEPLEGRVYTMYLDSKGLVTVGMGNLIEPIQLGMALPWRHRSDNRLATQSEYIAEWNLINGNPQLAHDGWRAAERYCKLHLLPEDVDALIRAKMESNESVLIRRVPGFANLCADAQLMLHMWAWAVGPNANYPRMLKYISRGDFIQASTECDVNPKKGTIVLRNSIMRQLLMNASRATPGQAALIYPELTTRDDDPGAAPDHSTTSLQHALALLGFNIVQDGIYGPKTKEAVTTFQRIHSLKQDGIAGPKTWAELVQQLRFR